MSHKYKFRTLQGIHEKEAMKDLFTEIFYPEKVGELAEVMFSHLPGTRPEYWFTVEDETGRLCSGLTLIPWTLKYQGITLKTAEMGIVGTLEAHRRKGLIRQMSQNLDETCVKEEYDLQIIQGVPGFYHRLGYHYAIALDNHINLPLNNISALNDRGYTISQCGVEEISFLAAEELIHNSRYSITGVRDLSHWEYLFSHGLATEYMSEFYIIEKSPGGDLREKYFFRINLMGFGTGLIVSEVSEEISSEALDSLFLFLKNLAEKREKPYVRFNLPAGSAASQRAFTLGAVQTGIYGWQVKITDRIRFLKKIRPLLEKRLSGSCFRNFTGTAVIDLYRSKISLIWENGKLKDISEQDTEAAMTLSITDDLFVPLSLGYRSLSELRYIRHDLYFEDPLTGEFFSALFPRGESWLNCQF